MLHGHYAERTAELETAYWDWKTITEARRAWREANPEPARDTVINFWVPAASRSSDLTEN